MSSGALSFILEFVQACPLLLKDWAILLHLIYFYYLLLITNYLITKLSITDNFSACRENTLLKTAYHFLLLLVGFDTLTYRKGYDRSPTLVGHHSPTTSHISPVSSFLAPFLSYSRFLACFLALAVSHPTAGVAMVFFNDLSNGSSFDDDSFTTWVCLSYLSRAMTWNEGFLASDRFESFLPLVVP